MSEDRAYSLNIYFSTVFREKKADAVHAKDLFF